MDGWMDGVGGWVDGWMDSTVYYLVLWLLLKLPVLIYMLLVATIVNFYPGIDCHVWFLMCFTVYLPECPCDPVPATFHPQGGFLWVSLHHLLEALVHRCWWNGSWTRKGGLERGRGRWMKLQSHKKTYANSWYQTVCLLPHSLRIRSFYLHVDQTHMSMYANNALLGGGVKVRIWIRE